MKREECQMGLMQVKTPPNILPRIRDLSNELEASKMKLRVSEDKLSRPSLHLIQLQNEMADMKVQHRLAIQQEQRNSSEIKEAAQRLDAAHEIRVSTLEARLAELSLSVGSYDRLRQQDLDTVSKLKEQIFELQRDRNGQCNVEEEEEEDDGCSPDKLIDKMVGLKAKLDQVSKSHGDVHIKALLEARGLSHSSDDEVCRKELLHTKQELERLKQEHGTKNWSDIHPKMSDDEINALRVQVPVLFLKNELQRCEDECNRSLVDARQSAAKERRTVEEKLAQTERSHRARIAELEHQFQKQRDRSLSLLQEKDEELTNLRHLLYQVEDAPLTMAAGAAGSTAAATSADPWPESIAPLASMSLGASASGGQILHYVEELARKTVEIQSLRRGKYQLESSLRELQMSTVALEQKTADQKSQLHEEIARLERNQSREGANLEYLKNVILEFLVCPDSSSQSHMFNAIATILHFSPSEMQRIQTEQSIW
uniref:EOG090X04IO n=1 Tax=Evadne anonyx TaxID=141404 RepID=A0A9N6ZE04_9CRUS|nr:EOG090X04IO [Evadne anonyx]